MLWPTSSNIPKPIEVEGNPDFYVDGVKYRHVNRHYCTTTGEQGYYSTTEVVRDPITKCPYCNKKNFTKNTPTGAQFCKHCRQFLGTI